MLRFQQSGLASGLQAGIAVAIGAGALLIAAPGHAQTMPPAPGDATGIERSESWDTVTTILALSAAGAQLITPRIFYSDPEVTVGWKARWHLSVLAPSMTLAAVSLLNEEALKDSFEGMRPGCTEETQGGPGCESFGMFSTHSLLAFSALGQGTGLFIVDSTKWSGGRFNAGAFTANVGVPAVLAVITAIGRTSGNWETGGQVWASAGVGFGLGLGLGALYATLQRPECGYTGSLICW